MESLFSDSDSSIRRCFWYSNFCFPLDMGEFELFFAKASETAWDWSDAPGFQSFVNHLRCSKKTFYLNEFPHISFLRRVEKLFHSCLEGKNDPVSSFLKYHRGFIWIHRKPVSEARTSHQINGALYIFTQCSEFEWNRVLMTDFNETDIITISGTDLHINIKIIASFLGIPLLHFPNSMNSRWSKI